MKKVLLVALLTMTACCATTKKTQVTVDAIPDASTSCTEAGCSLLGVDASTNNANVNDIVQEDNWQFTLTGPNWTPVPNVTGGPVKVAFQNPPLLTKLVFVKEATKQPTPQYLINTIHAIRAPGTTIKSTQNVTINGNDFVRIDAADDSNTGWFWVTVKAGNGYILACSVEKPNQELQDADCGNVASTIQIK